MAITLYTTPTKLVENLGYIQTAYTRSMQSIAAIARQIETALLAYENPPDENDDVIDALATAVAALKADLITELGNLTTGMKGTLSFYGDFEGCSTPGDYFQANSTQLQSGNTACEDATPFKFIDDLDEVTNTIMVMVEGFDDEDLNREYEVVAVADVAPGTKNKLQVTPSPGAISTEAATLSANSGFKIWISSIETP